MYLLFNYLVGQKSKYYLYAAIYISEKFAIESNIAVEFSLSSSVSNHVLRGGRNEMSLVKSSRLTARTYCPSRNDLQEFLKLQVSCSSVQVWRTGAGILIQSVNSFD